MLLDDQLAVVDELIDAMDLSAADRYSTDINLIISGWPQTRNTQGFLQTWKTRGILREFCAASGKNCNKQSIFYFVIQIFV